MHFTLKILTIATFVLAFALLPLPSIRADWDPSQPAKYVQMPDPLGMNVNATWLTDPTNPNPVPIYPYQKVLADDFPCFAKGPITDLHIWGSWLNDQYTPDGSLGPFVNPNTSFKLSIHADVPKGVDAPYSHPGKELWSQIFSPTQYSMRVWGGPTDERFYDPNTNQVLGRDTRTWQYNFLVDPSTAFVQQGPDALGNPTIYWLDVQAIVPRVPGAPETIFGCKTTIPNPNDPLLGDDAVFADTPVPGGVPVGPGTIPGVPWVDMHYPSGGLYEGQSIDMAFVVTPEPSTSVLLILSGFGGGLVWIRRRMA